MFSTLLKYVAAVSALAGRGGGDMLDLLESAKSGHLLSRQRLERRANTITQVIDNVVSIASPLWGSSGFNGENRVILPARSPLWLLQHANSAKSGGYYANVTVGTPPQDLRLQLCTASADIWVNTYSTYCSSASPSPCIGGLYSSNKSSTYQYISSDLSESYGSNFYLSGDWAKDIINVGTTNVQHQRFGIAYNTSETPGQLGIGYQGLELTKTQYANLPAKVKQQGLTDVNAFSIWTNSISEEHGAITFGGVDTNKFYGSLETISLTEDQGARINLDKVQISYNGKTTALYSNPISVIIEVEYGSMVLPPEITNPLFASYDVSYDGGNAFVNPSQLANTSTLDFVFQGKTISVDMIELVVPYNETASRFAASVGNSVADGEVYYLGNVFLRSAFAVFDWDNQEISLAQSNFASTDRKIEAIPAGGIRAMSGLTGVASGGSTATSAATPTSTSTSSPSSSSTSSPPSANSGLSTGAKTGIGIGVALGVLALLAIIGTLVFMRRRRRQDTGRSQNGQTAEEIPMKYSEHPPQEMDTEDQQRHEMENKDPWHNGMGYRLDGPSELEGLEFPRHELDAR